jgi:hypothetical protein
MSSARLVGFAASLGLLVGAVTAAPAARAEPGDPAGWSVATDPRHRAFLIVTATAGGPRLLTIACLRDVDDFAIHAPAIPGLAAADGPVDLTLAVADATFALAGTVEADGGGVGFTGSRDLDAKNRKALAAALVPVLEAAGPLVVTVGAAPPIAIPLEDLPPKKGIAGPLKTFVKVCFGR